MSTIFGLFSALLVNDVWQGATSAKRAVQVESGTVREIDLMARAANIDGVILPRLLAYVKAATLERPSSSAITIQRSEIGGAYEALLRALGSRPQLDPSMRAALLVAARDLFRAHEERLHYASDFTAPIKWAAILVFGAITQIALMLVHLGNRTPMRIAVGLFTVAFIFCLVIIAVFDAPFDFVLADEPAASLRLALPNR